MRTARENFWNVPAEFGHGCRLGAKNQDPNFGTGKRGSLWTHRAEETYFFEFFPSRCCLLLQDLCKSCARLFNVLAEVASWTRRCCVWKARVRSARVMGAGGAADIDSARPSGTAKWLCRMVSRSGVCGEAGGRAPAAHAAPGAMPCELAQDPPHACASRTGASGPPIVHRSQADARSFAFGNPGGARGRRNLTISVIL